MEKYKVTCHILGSYTRVVIEKEIECRELTIRENCYTFWKGEYGKSNELIASYPIQYTIIENMKNDE
jgi:hypothetical protein